MPKYENRTISKTVNPINPKFEDKAESTTCTSWVGYHYSKPNPAWLTVAVLKIAMTPELCSGWSDSDVICMPMKNHMPMTVKRLKSKPEVEFQYSGCLFSETGSSNISTANWNIWSKFGMPIASDIPKCYMWPNQKPAVDLRRYGRHLAKSIWRHNSIDDHLICIKFGRPVQNHMPMTVKGHNRNRK